MVHQEFRREVREPHFQGHLIEMRYDHQLSEFFPQGISRQCISKERDHDYKKQNNSCICFLFK